MYGVQVAAHAMGEGQLHYKPGSIGQPERGSVTVTSQVAGTTQYECIGKVGCKGLSSCAYHAQQL